VFCNALGNEGKQGRGFLRSEGTLGGDKLEKAPCGGRPQGFNGNS